MKNFVLEMKVSEWLKQDDLEPDQDESGNIKDS